MLKNRNRTLLEVDTGILVLAFLATGFALPLHNWSLTAADWLKGIWAAAAFAVLSYLHMYRSLDRALDYDEANAQKMIFRGYLTRYVVFAAVLIAAAVTGTVNPLILCLGYMFFVKVAAYIQPYTHKFYNFLFHEQDPVPEPLADLPELVDDRGEGGEKIEKAKEVKQL